MSDYEFDDEEAYDEGYDSDGLDDEDDVIVESNSYQDKGKKKADDNTFSYENFSQEELLLRIDREITDASSILDIERALVLALMPHNRWNKIQLIENFTESPERVLKAIGGAKAQLRYYGVNKELYSPKRRKVEPIKIQYDCNICCGQYKEENMLHLGCQHRFCVDCWNTFLTGQIKEEGQCFITCMEDGCPLPVSELFIESIVDKECRERYQVLIIQSYVTAVPDWSFCPHPSCNRIVHCQNYRKDMLTTVVPSVDCGVGHTFCFGCKMDQSHGPTICLIAKRWKTSKDDSGTSQWIKANTRTCPKCGNNIEKSGGCNRMICRHCKYQFCWMCMKNWDVHGYDKTVCNAFVEPPKTENMNKAAVHLERWLFYFDRFNNHELSAALDDDLCKSIANKIKEIQNSSNLSWIEARFMQIAFDELTKCRMTLKWTYAMAHFLAAGNKKHLFEDIQADLEKAVEQLSELLNEQIIDAKISELRQKVIDKTVYVQKRHEVLLEDVATGLLEGEWEWTIPIE